MTHDSALAYPCDESDALPADWRGMRLGSQGDVPAIAFRLPTAMQTHAESSTSPYDWFRLWSGWRHSTNSLTWRVYVAVFERDLDPGQLLQQILTQPDNQIIQARSHVQPFGVDADILVRHRRRPPGASSITRNLCRKYGRCMVWLQAEANESEYDSLADDVWRLLRGVLVEGTLGDFAEPISRFDLRHPFAINCLHPTSWSVLRSELSEALVHLTFANQLDEQTVSRIDAVIQRGGTEQALLARFLNLRRQLGLSTVVPDLRPIYLPHGGQRFMLPPHKIRIDGGGDLESLAYYFRYKNYWIWFDRLSAGKEESPYWWLVCERAFQLVTWSLRIDDERPALQDSTAPDLEVAV